MSAKKRKKMEIQPDLIRKEILRNNNNDDDYDDDDFNY